MISIIQVIQIISEIQVILIIQLIQIIQTSSSIPAIYIVWRKPLVFFFYRGLFFLSILLFTSVMGDFFLPESLYSSLQFLSHIGFFFLLRSFSIEDFFLSPHPIIHFVLEVFFTSFQFFTSSSFSVFIQDFFLSAILLFTSFW